MLLLPKEVMTEERFREWLQSKKPNDVVGFVTSGRDCSLALFAQDKGYALAIVNETDWKPSRYKGSIPLPSWAKEFVLREDEAGLLRTTAQQALTLLQAD